MEDWKAWVTTTSFLALHSAGVQEEILEMWGYLRSAIVYNTQYLHGQHQERYIAEMQDNICMYAYLAEKAFGQHDLLTHQLHICCLHLPEQTRQCGPAAYQTEHWVERMCGGFKKITKYRSSRYPELAAVNHLLFQAAMADKATARGHAVHAYEKAQKQESAMDLEAHDARDQHAEMDDHEAENFLVGALHDMSTNDEEVRDICQLDGMHSCTGKG